MARSAPAWGPRLAPSPGCPCGGPGCAPASNRRRLSVSRDSATQWHMQRVAVCGGQGCAPARTMQVPVQCSSAAAAAAHIHSQSQPPRAAPQCRAQLQPCSSGPPCGHTAAARLGTRVTPAAPAPQPPAPESRPQSCSGPAARERRQQGTSAGCASHIAGHGGGRPSSTQVGGLLLLLPSYSCCNNCSGVLPPAAAARRPPPL